MIFKLKLTNLNDNKSNLYGLYYIFLSKFVVMHKWKMISFIKLLILTTGVKVRTLSSFNLCQLKNKEDICNKHDNQLSSQNKFWYDNSQKSLHDMG